MGKQIGKSFISSLAPGEKFIGVGVLAAVIGFFLPAISISVSDKAAQLIAFLLGPLAPVGSGDETHTSISFFDITKILGVAYFFLLLAVGSGVLFYFSRRAAAPRKLLFGGFQIVIGSLYGPSMILGLLFIPGMGLAAGIGYWLLCLGYCAIAAGGLITVATVGKTAQ